MQIYFWKTQRKQNNQCPKEGKLKLEEKYIPADMQNMTRENTENDTNTSHSPSPSIPWWNPKLLAWMKYPRKNVQLRTFKKINGYIENPSKHKYKTWKYKKTYMQATGINVRHPQDSLQSE